MTNICQHLVLPPLIAGDLGRPGYRADSGRPEEVRRRGVKAVPWSGGTCGASVGASQDQGME